MPANRLPAEFVDDDARGTAGGNEPQRADGTETVELSDRGRETLDILNDLFDDEDGDELDD